MIKNNILVLLSIVSSLHHVRIDTHSGTHTHTHTLTHIYTIKLKDFNEISASEFLLYSFFFYLFFLLLFEFVSDQKPFVCF